MAALPTVKQLRYLVALEKHQHFGKAAESCHVSQSAFSVAIRELESALDVKLVDRTNRSVTFTPIGRQVTSQARLCLFDLEGLMDIANEQRDPLSGELRLGVIPTIAPFMLPRILPGIRNKYSKLDLYLREDQTLPLYRELMRGGLDIILIALPYELKGVHAMTLFKDKFLLAVHKNSHLLDDPEHFRVNRLKGGEILLLEEGHCLREHVLSALNVRDRDKLNRFSATSLHTLVQMVDNDLGISFVPEMAVDSTLLNGTQVTLHSMSKAYEREIALIWRASSARNEEFTQFGQLMKELMQVKSA
ncbi:MAG: hydrogen peroxide-inducible genes activator [Gammaproteobacteria bacterium]|nr:MAG: hydrogen peroxide-inducible genes activator [Gammaproteobacteria bacterium]